MMDGIKDGVGGNGIKITKIFQKSFVSVAFYK
jgi:hypothetical protein